MARSVSLRSLALAPLRTGGTSLPPVAVLIAKLLAGALVIEGYWKIPPRHLPFLPFLDAVDPNLWRYALLAAFAAGAALLMLHRAVRPACLAIGGALVLATLASRPTFANSRLYPGCVLLLAGLSDRGSGPLGGAGALRLQVAILYFGAGLNKLLDPDWLDGRYFEAWMNGPYGSPAYRAMAARLPPLWLSTLMGWVTITTEAVMTVSFLRPSLYALGIACGLLFHGGALLLLHEDFGAFLIAVLISLLAFVPWPERVRVTARSGSWSARLAALLRALDPDGRYEVSTGPGEDRGLEIETLGRGDGRDRQDRGFPAFQRMLLHHPATLWAGVLGMTVPWGRLARLREAVLVLFVLLTAPTVGRAAAALAARLGTTGERPTR